jgi:hypothetical protein
MPPRFSPTVNVAAVSTPSQLKKGFDYSYARTPADDQELLFSARKRKLAEDELAIARATEATLQQEVLIAQSVALKSAIQHDAFRRSLDQAEQLRQREILNAERYRQDDIQRQRLEQEAQALNLSLHAERERSRIRLAERAATVEESKVNTENRVLIMKAQNQYLITPPQQRYGISYSRSYYYEREGVTDLRSLEEIERSNAAMRKSLDHHYDEESQGY